MSVLDFLQNLELPAMLAATFALSVAFAWATIGTVRLGVRWSGFNPASPLPIKDTLIGATSAVFALTLAFSASGIWNDTVQARSAVQREAQALENMLALTQGLPAELQQDVKDGITQYIRRVVDFEWPAMAHLTGTDSTLPSRSDHALVQLIDDLARQAAKTDASPVPASVLTQLFEARSARLARLTVAEGGVTPAQWTALLLLALSALFAVALTHNHHFGIQIVAMHLYAVVAATAFFLIVAHDRPFVGIVSAPPTPLLQLLAQPSAELSPAVAQHERRQGAGLD